MYVALVASQLQQRDVTLLTDETVATFYQLTNRNTKLKQAKSEKSSKIYLTFTNYNRATRLKKDAIICVLPVKGP